MRGFKDTDAKIDEARELLSESRVAEVDAMIAQLGEESVLSEILDYGQLVTDAVDAYNELTEEEKGRVGGLGVLEVAQVFYFVADGNQGTALGIIQQSTAMSDEQVMRCLRKYAIYTSIDDVLSELKGMMKNRLHSNGKAGRHHWVFTGRRKTAPTEETTTRSRST